MIFNTEFNISFGYPRSDTCSTCDKFIAKTDDIDAKLNSEECHDNRDDLLKQKRQLEVYNDLYKRKAYVFYSHKRRGSGKG